MSEFEVAEPILNSQFLSEPPGEVFGEGICQRG